MRCLLFALLFLLIQSCQEFSRSPSTEDKAQEMIDKRQYLKAARYLEARELTPKRRSLLVDAYIGASGFEILGFLEDIEFALSLTAEEKHPILFLKSIFRPISKLNQNQKDYIERALKLAESDAHMGNFKIGVVNLYSAVEILKSIGEEYAPKLVIDVNSQRELLLNDKEKLDLARKIDSFIGHIFRSYAHLRESFDHVSEYFGFLDSAIEDLLGVEIENIRDFKELNIEKIIKVFLENNPKTVKRVALWLTKECDSGQTRNAIKELIAQLEGNEGFSNYLYVLRLLLKELEKLEDVACDDEIINSIVPY